MSKEFDQINNIVLPLNQEIQLRKRNQEAKKNDLECFYQGIKEDEAILNRYGVKSIFEEIRDSGLVKWDDKPVYKKEPIYIEKFFGGKIIDHYEEKKISDYAPARIQENDHKDVNKYNMRDKREVSLSLTFYGKLFDDKQSCSTHYSEIKIVVHEGKLNIVGYKNFRYSYTPIEEGKLIETIAEAIKNPPIIWY